MLARTIKSTKHQIPIAKKKQQNKGRDNTSNSYGAIHFLTKYAQPLEGAIEKPYLKPLSGIVEIHDLMLTEWSEKRKTEANGILWFNT